MDKHLQLKIDGMTCNSCSNAITARLSKFDFTSNVKVDWEKGSGELDIEGEFEEKKAIVINTINQLGYQVIK